MTNNISNEQTPKEVVSELDKYIIGQDDAKKAVAIALRNRWRRQQIKGDLKDDVSPKNIILIGPTGCGKTEISRRLARISKSPFFKVDATKYTEVGYVGKDVESMIRDLTELAVRLKKTEASEKVEKKAKNKAIKRIIERLKKKDKKKNGSLFNQPNETVMEVFPSGEIHKQEILSDSELKEKILNGEMDDIEIELSIEENNIPPMVEIFSPSGGFDDMNMQNMLGSILPKKRKNKEIKIKEALPILINEETHKLIDTDRAQREALEAVEQNGIIFLDEIDKITTQEKAGGPEVSREGVQRDLLPIIEGTSVNTKYGMVKTDHILFIASGAFHVSKPSDLIPELQGRFPIRVELKALTKNDFVRILNEPQNSLIKQYQALIATEGIDISFDDKAIDTISEISTILNNRMENIGARRLYAVMEKLLEEISFKADEIAKTENTITITVDYVHSMLDSIMEDRDMSKYIL